MNLTELEALLGMTIVGTPQETRYAALLNAAIAHVNDQCGNRFTDAQGAVALPDGVKMGVALVVRSMTENQAVASQSLGDMSKSFFEGGTYKSARRFWRNYQRISFR